MIKRKSRLIDMKHFLKELPEEIRGIYGFWDTDLSIFRGLCIWKKP